MTEEELSLTGQQNDLSSFVSDEGGIWSLRQVEKVRGWNNIEYGAGLSGKNTPSTGLSMNRAYIPPGGIAKEALGTNTGPDAGNQWSTAKGTCFTLSRGFHTRCLMSQKPNGYMRLSQDRMLQSGRTSFPTIETQIDITGPGLYQ